MIRKIVSVINNLHLKNHSNVSGEYANELSQERLYTNMNREKTLSTALALVSVALIFSDLVSLGTPSGNVIKVILGFHVLLFFLAISFIICKYLGEKLVTANAVYWKVLHIGINIFVLVICSFLTVMSKFSGMPPYSYVVSIFSIASLVVLTIRESILIYSSTFLLYVAGKFMSHLNASDILRDLLFTLLLIILAIFIAKSNYIAFVNNFINRKVILRQNLELDQSNRMTEEALKKRTEELNQALEYDKLRSNFFANVSHELKTPLAVIFSAEQMLDTIINNPQMYEKQKDTNKYIGIIRQNCYRLIRLISNLIDITKLDTGYLKAKFEVYNIVKIVEDITMSVAKYIEFMKISLTFDTESEEIVIAFDPEKIERIMLNLLSNAVKFTPKGGQIWVNIYEREDRVDICVKDTGIGIPAVMKDLIFERFVQLDATNTRSREGSGIGLSLVKSLVDLHNGSISLISEVGVGSEFTISIPKSLISPEETPKVYDFANERQNIEKINIEFSDIYS